MIRRKPHQFSEDQDELIRIFARRGWRLAEAAERLKCSKFKVRYRAEKLGVSFVVRRRSQWWIGTPRVN